MEKLTHDLIQSGKLIRLSFAIAEGKFNLGINAAKLMLLIFADFVDFAKMIDDNDDIYQKRTVYVGDIDVFNAQNTYETMKKAVKELSSAKVIIKLNDGNVFLNWFTEISYARGYLSYKIDDNIAKELINLNAKPGGYYVSVSPVILPNFDSFLALRLYLFAQLYFVRHKNHFNISPWDLANFCRLKSSYWPKQPGYVEGSKYAVSHQYSLINKALENINNNTDIALTFNKSTNKRGRVHDWGFTINTAKKLNAEEEIYYEMISNGCEGEFSVKLTLSQYETIKKEFPSDWEARLEELSDFQESRGFRFFNPLYSIRKGKVSGVPGKLKRIRKDNRYVDPPRVFIKGQPSHVSEDYYKAIENKDYEE